MRWLLNLFLFTALAACGGGGEAPSNNAGSTDVGSDSAAADPDVPSGGASQPDPSAPGDTAAPIDPAPGAAPPPVSQTMASGLLTTTPVATNLTSPWSLVFLPDGTALVSEKSGVLRRIEGGVVGTPIAGVPSVADAGQGGLLGMTLSPNFASDGLLYFCFSEPAQNGTTRTAIARGQLAAAQLSDVEVIFRQSPAVDSTVHYGCRLVFGRDGMLYAGLGERGQRDMAQLLDNTLGKVVRLAPDGSIPADNPFVGRPDALDAIYSYGHRNPQGLARHPGTGEIWLGEHGPLGGDEINRIVAGANYGWPRVTTGREYADGAAIGEGTTAPDVQPPLRDWVPTSVAPAGMVFYTGTAVPVLEGSLLMGTLADKSLVRLFATHDAITGEERLLDSLNARIRDVAQSPDGHPYIITDDGRLIRIEAR